MSKQPKPRERPELVMGHAAMHYQPQGGLHPDEIMRIIRANKRREQREKDVKRRRS